MHLICICGLDRIIGTSFNIIVENDEQAEISFTRMYNRSQQGSMVPLNIDIRYVYVKEKKRLC